MPVFYNYTENGVAYSFDDVFVPADAFREGNLFTWGRNLEGQLGNNTIITRSTPITTFAGGTNWKQVAGGRYNLLAIKTDGTLWGWGWNFNGSLGINNTTYPCTPVTTFAGGTNWKQVSGGYRHTAAIKTDGTLWTWGSNGSGQLGDNTTTQRLTPVTTFSGGTNWKQVSCGGYHTSAIKTDGTLWIWGESGYGRLGGNDNFPSRPTPVTTFAGGTNWKQVSATLNHTTAIKTDGTLWTWGRNRYGELGINDSGTGNVRYTPVTTFAGGTNWKQVVGSGNEFSAAIKTDGTLWVWGYGSTGALGTNDPIQRNTPVTTFAGGTNWKQVTCGSSHTAAIKTDGTLWTWGYNAYGNLGNNTVVGRSTPVTTFAGGTNWKQVAGGGDHTAATTYIDSYQ
jgi:alpha-tubulin suppressor-like RCC1 family protein